MGGSQKQNSAQSYSPYALSAFQDVLSQAQNVAGSTNYNPATAIRVADLSPQQMQGFGGISALQGKYDPTMAQAMNTAGSVASGVNPSAISSWMNPYQQNVINATMANAQQQQGQTMANVVGNQIAQNAYGGDRAQLQKALTAGQFALANNQTIAGLEQQGYNQAVSNAMANNAQMLQGAYGLGNLAQAGQGMDLGQLSALIGAGQAQQQQQQNVYNAASQNASAQTMWPLQMTQWLANITGGIGSAMGGTTYGSSETTQNPGVLQWMGAIGAGASAMSDERLKENKRVVGKTFDGQPIYSYNFKGDNVTHLGLLAQEVEKSHPEAVGERDGWKTVNYDEATKDSAERGSFANGGMADGGFASGFGGGSDPWSSLLSRPMQYGAPQTANVLHAPQGEIGGNFGQYQKSGEAAGKGLKAGWDKAKKLFDQPPSSSQGVDAGASSSAAPDAASSTPETPSEDILSTFGFDMANGGFPGGDDAWGSMLSQPMHFSAPQQPSAPQPAPVDFGDSSGKKKESGGGGPKGQFDKLQKMMHQPGSQGGSGAAQPAGTQGTGPNSINSTGWQSFFDPNFGAPGSAVAGQPAAGLAGEGAAGAATSGGEAAGAAGAAGEGAAGAAGAAGEGAAAAGEAAAGAGAGAGAAAEGAGAAAAGAGEAAAGGAEGIGSAIGALIALLKRGGAVDADRHLRTAKHVRRADGGEVDYGEILHRIAARHLADGGDAGPDPFDDAWDVRPHEERYLWNPYATRTLPGGGVDPHAAYDTMHMRDMPPIAGAAPSAPAPTEQFPPMAGPSRSSPSANEPLPPIAGQNIVPETRRWTENAPPVTEADYTRDRLNPGQGVSRPPMFGPAPSPDAVMAEGQRQIDQTVQPAIDYVRGVFNGSTRATGEFASNVWDAIKSKIPEGNSLTPEEAAALRKEIADRPGVLERMWPSIQEGLQAGAEGHRRAFEQLRKDVSGISGPTSLTPEEARQARYERALETGAPTHENLVPPQEATGERGYIQNSLEHLARMPGDIGRMAREALAQPVQEFAGNVGEAAGALPGRISNVMKPTPDVNEAVSRQPSTAMLRGAPYGFGASQQPTPPLPERGLQPSGGEPTPPLPERGLQPAAPREPYGPNLPEKSLGRTLYERIFPNLSGANRLNAPAGAPEGANQAPSVEDVAATPVKTFRVEPNEAPTGPIGEGQVPGKTGPEPSPEPYAFGAPAPKAEAGEEEGGRRVSMTARLGFEGNVGSVAADKGGWPSVGRYGIHAEAGPTSSARDFVRDFGAPLGITADPNTWTGAKLFVQQWKRAAAETPDALMRAEDAWHQKYIVGPADAHLAKAGASQAIRNDEGVKEYMQDRLIQHGAGITGESQRRYKEAMTRASQEEGGATPQSFLKALTDIDRAHTAHDFRTYLGGFSDPEKRQKAYQGLINRVNNRFAGATGEAVKPAGKSETAQPSPAGAYKSPAEMLPAERQQAGFIQKLFGGWNPLEPITGPGPNGPGTDLLGLSSDQRRNLMQFSLGLMQGPFMSQSAAGAGQALHNIQQYGLEQSKLGMEQAKLGIEALKIPKYQAFHTIDPFTGQQTTTLYNARTGEIMGGGAGVGAGAPAAGGAIPQIPQNVHGEQAMTMIPEQYRGELAGVVSGETPITNYRAGPQRELWTRLARQIDPEWSERKAQLRQDFRKGIVNQSTTEGKLAHSFNAATGHLNDAISLNDVLPDNASAVAGVRGWWNDKFGNDPYRAAWKTMALGLADEVSKIQGGGSGAEAERLRWLEKFSPDQPRAVRAANLAAAVRIMTSHLNDMDRTYQNVMGKWGNPYEFLGPEGRATIQRSADKFGRYTGGKPVIPGEGAPAANAPAAGQAGGLPRVRSKEEYDRIQPGAVYINENTGMILRKAA